MELTQKKQIDYVAYVKNMFNISEKERELYVKKKELYDKVSEALNCLEQELTKDGRFYLVDTHNYLVYKASFELAGIFFYYKKREKGLLSFARKTAIEAFKKYGFKIAISRLERMPKEYRHYYLGVVLSKAS